MKQLKTMLLEEAAYYDAPMNEIKLRMFAEQLSKVPLPDLARAMEYFRQTPGRRQMPMPADLIGYLRPPMDDDTVAREAAARIIQAVKRHGWTQRQEARELMGEVAWMTVEKLGGWNHVCESLRDDQLGTFMAQARDLAKAQLALSRSGKLDQAPALPQFTGAVEKLVGSAIKRIGPADESR